MDEKILDIVLQRSLTLHQAYKHLRILKEYLTYQIFGAQQATLEKEDQAFIDQIDKDLLQQFTKDNLASEFEKILSQLEKIPVLVVYFGFQPDNELIKSISDWIKNNYSERIILDSKIDNNLIAGCSLVWKGIYKDYSLKAKIEDHRQEILTYLSQTLHRT